MGLDRYEYDPDRQPDDGDSPYPYQEFYGGGKNRRHRSLGGGWVALLFLVVVAVGAAFFFSRFTIDVRQTADGMTLSIQDTSRTPAAPELTEAPDIGSEVIAVPAAGVGTGTELAVSATPVQPSASLGNGGGLSLQEIYQKVIPSVVSITTTLRNGSASGTGIIMSSDGYLITNDHVIQDAMAIEVLTADDQVFSACLVGSDTGSDLAVLKIAAEDLVAAEFGDSAEIQVGDAVVAIGDPLGKKLRGTMTDGIISAINRDLMVNGRSMTLLQTNAALNNGNSGGPLINAYGQVIGINTMKMSAYYSSASVEGLGFAIPISAAKPIVDELIAQGYVSGRPAIGITGKSLPSVAQAYYHLPTGVYIETVEPGSDAYAKGIAVGDIITAIEGMAVADMDELNVVKNQFAAGDTVNLTIYRSGELYSVDVTLMDASGF